MKVITTSSMVVHGGCGSGLAVTPTTVVSLMRSLDSGPSLCFPQTVRMQTRKVSVATMTSHGCVEQNSPWLLKTFLTPLVNMFLSSPVTNQQEGSPQPLKQRRFLVTIASSMSMSAFRSYLKFIFSLK